MTTEGGSGMHDLLIYGMKGSPFVRKVQVVLAEKGLPYDFEMASPFPAPDWFVAINPAKRIPVLRDRSVGAEGVAGTIPDSSAICAYLERKYPRPALYPQDDFAFARALGDAPPSAREVAGSGFRDFTRIARSDPELWAEILVANRKAVQGPLARVAERLGDLARALETGDVETMDRWIAEARVHLDAATNGNDRNRARSDEARGPRGEGHNPNT